MQGKLIAHYEVLEKIGAGGMGVVYRAMDSRLDREVAIKALPAGLVGETERVARFEREAKLLASLNHAHLATVYGLEQVEGQRFIVMELVDGESLAGRLAKGPIPVREALELARQIAEGLEAAHEAGVVHRDLKPGNIMVGSDGKAKVLDFGLAKALSPETSEPDLSITPTLTQPMTRAGQILGTPAYMSPEQAQGRPAGKQADVWAFGCVLYEMLTGRRAFERTPTIEDGLEPDWEALPARLPLLVRSLIRRCLQKDLRRRLHDIADARIVLEELSTADWQPPVAAVAPASSRWPGWVAAFALGSLVSIVVLHMLEPELPVLSASAPHAHFQQLTFLAGAESAPALSPDGESLAYVKEVDGQLDIFMQRVGGGSAVNLTEGCHLDDDEPDFSPDGRRIAYRSECSGKGIFVMGAMGDSARKVISEGHDPDWSPDGLELVLADEKVQSPFGRSGNSGIWAVRIETGERRSVSRHDGLGPSWSPDGRLIAFWGMRESGLARDLFIASADGSRAEPEAVISVLDDPAVDFSPVWSPDGEMLLFASTRGGTMNLWRIGLDPSSGEPRGEPAPVTTPSSWAGYLSASADGQRIAFVDRNVRSTIRLAAFDPAKAELAGPARSIPIGSFEVHGLLGLAPDGGVIFASSGLPQHLYIADEDGLLRQLTDGPHRDRQATFSPDGSWIAFQTDRWASSLAMIRPDGSGLREVATGHPASIWYPTFAPDGRWLALTSSKGALRLPLEGAKAAGPAEPLPFPDEGLLFWPSSFSPDGQRLAGTVRSQENLGKGAAILDLAEGVYERISNKAVRVAVFLPGGDRVLMVTGEGLEVLELDTGTVHVVASPPEGSAIFWADLSPDGRQLTWHESNDESDIWLASFEPLP